MKKAVKQAFKLTLIALMLLVAPLASNTYSISNIYAYLNTTSIAIKTRRAAAKDRYSKLGFLSYWGSL